MAGQEQAMHGVTCVSAEQRPGWKPSRFFDEWKESVAEIKGELLMQYMHYCRGMPAHIRLEAIDHILRCTLPVVYVSDDRSEATEAMYNDEHAIREYATRFLDGFWDDYWKPFLTKRHVSAEDRPQSL